jgi:PAS domain S-box-containing protein
MVELNDTSVRAQLLSRVFRDAVDPILIEDLDGLVVDMNREAERSYGWSREDLIGWPIKTIVPPQRHGQADDLLARCRTGEEVRNIEGLRWTKDKEIIPVLLTLSLLRDEEEKAIAIVTIAKDISTQKQAEEELRQMARVFKDAADPILLEDLEGLVVDMNKEAEYSYGWSRDDLIGRPIKTIVPPERYGQADDLLARCKAGERVRNIEGLRWTKDKEIIPVLLTLSLLKNENEQPVRIATIAKDISALKQAEEEIALTQDVTIESMGTLAEYRDPETGGHIKRTRAYVRSLANHLKGHPKFKDVLDDTTIEILYKSACLHDIGKVAIPDSILLKAGKLSKDEFEIMKKHTTYGMEAIAIQEERLGDNSFLHFAREIAETHQEKWDGTGYPEGLKGEEIPVAGRLMALADVYDALISKRVYKPSFPHRKAVEIISEGKGVHFDPDMVEAFLELEDEFRKIALEYADFDEERENLETNR